MIKLVPYVLALIVMAVFRSKPLVSGWKWMLCTVFGAYTALLSSVSVYKLFSGFLPAELRPYCLALTMMLIFMIVNIALLIIIEKIAPGGGSYNFPRVIGKVLAALCRGVAVIAASMFIVQCAAAVPLPESSQVRELIQTSDKLIMRIIAVVDRCSGQGCRKEEISASLASLKYVPPAENSETAAPAADPVPDAAE